MKTEAIEKALELVTDEVASSQALKHLLDKGTRHLHYSTYFFSVLARINLQEPSQQTVLFAWSMISFHRERYPQSPPHVHI